MHKFLYNSILILSLLFFNRTTIFLYKASESADLEKKKTDFFFFVGQKKEVKGKINTTNLLTNLEELSNINLNYIKK